MSLPNAGKPPDDDCVGGGRIDRDFRAKLICLSECGRGIANVTIRPSTKCAAKAHIRPPAKCAALIKDENVPESSLKPIVEQCLYFSVAKLAKQGLLRGGSRWTSVLTWPHGAESRISVACESTGGGFCVYLDYVLVDRDGYEFPKSDCIYLSGEPSRVGGWRWWLICPRCEVRRRILFVRPGHGYFACRVCHGLRYASTLLSRRQRRWRRGIF